MKSKLILGTVQFGLDYGINNDVGKPSFGKVCQILDFAFDNGVKVLDTAEAYGNSQDVIGSYHKISNQIFNIITKYSPNRTDLPEGIVERINLNLETLGVDTLYAYMFHSFADYRKYYKIFSEDLIELRELGIIKKIGVSLYTNDELEQVIKCEEIDLIQLPFNLLDNNYQRGEVLQKAKNRGVEIHTRSVFLQGLFFKELLEDKLSYFTLYLKQLRDMASSDFGISDLALNYVCKQANIDNVLIGVDNIEQLNSNFISLQKDVPVEIQKSIDLINVKDKSMLNPSNW
ncbi:aldo/keto reductase [Labilibaculum sp. DW002]|uniref:Aldo/keto reductase n=1 Tax=Paralabilibaculum antarcticum TaxID=2912572 RepID=A0ABT5VP67_9BACT|nr:aldo/keto reductase [Labilibaculum sp. DW002]MDE5417232.1 aldo/keto reductase [Labilibaculum sp. DW002]